MSALVTIPDLIAPRHRRVAKMVGYALALTLHEGRPAFTRLSRILRDALPTPERTSLAYAALGACEPQEAQSIVEALFDTRDPHRVQGPPEAFLADDPVEDAKWWASTASDNERWIYAMACLLHLEEAERHHLVASLEGRRAA